MQDAIGMQGDNEGVMVQRTEHDDMGGTALSDHVAAGSHAREHDAESQHSNAFTATHSGHSQVRSDERNISTEEIKQAKAGGALALGILYKKIPLSRAEA